MQNPIPSPSFYAIIPAHVRYSDIESNAKLLYGEITALCGQEGYCWASNEYFAGLYKVDVRTVRRWLQSLKEHRFIVVENGNNLEKDNHRKIWIGSDIKKMFTEGQKCPGGRTKMSATPIYNNTTSNNPPIAPKGDMPIPPKKRIRKKEELLQRNSRVWTTQSQHDFLLKKANNDESLVTSWYERLEKWKIDKQFEGGNDYKHLSDWVQGAVEQEKNSPRKIVPNNKALLRKKWAMENERAYTSQAGSAFADEERFTIHSGATSVSYKYHEESAFWKEIGL